MPADDLLTGARGQGRRRSRSWRATAGSRCRTRPSRPASPGCSSEGGAQLDRDGYSAQSAFLTSPTFGGVSWLAHSTLQSGVWVDSQQKYDRLIAERPARRSRRAFERCRLAHGRGRALQHASRGRRARRSTGTTPCSTPATWAIAGPAFSYARMPDQYTWKHFYDRELAARARSGHGRDRLRVVAHAVDAGAPPRAVVRDRRRLGVRPAARRRTGPGRRCGPTRSACRRLYGQSVEYTLGAMFSFLHTYDQPDLVLVVLGDHQPARIVSGPDADRDVPITIISKDPAVFDEHRLVAVGCRRPPVAGGAGLADGSVPRPVRRGLRPLTPARQASRTGVRRGRVGASRSTRARW